MTDDAKCYGGYRNGNEACLSCEYCTSCQLYTKTQGQMEQRIGGMPYDEVADYAQNIADYSNIPGAVEEDEISQNEQSDFAGFLNFLLHLDDYTLGIISEIIAPSGNRPPSVSDLSRIHGISRQGMHRKTLDIARKSPELRSLLKLSVMKIRKSKQDFRDRKTSRIETLKQMELGL